MGAKVSLTFRLFVASDLLLEVVVVSYGSRSTAAFVFFLKKTCLNECFKTDLVFFTFVLLIVLLKLFSTSFLAFSFSTTWNRRIKTPWKY